MNRLILGVIVIVVFSVNSFGQTISGAITSDTTWSPVTGTVVADSVYVPAGRILTILPGTRVEFKTGKMLVVAGKIIASGKADSTIIFTSNSVIPAPGNWNGIELQNSALVSSVINYCVIEYAGGGPNAASIFYKTGAPNINISNSVIRLSSNNGINPRSSSPRISTTTFRNNTGYGIFADLSLSFTVDSCTIANNSTGGMLIGVNSTATIVNSAIDSNGTGIFISNSAAPTIKKNNIRRNNIGIQFTGVGATQPAITQDTIINNTTWGFLNTGTSTTVLVRRNYWGSDTGPFNPSSNPTGLGNKVSNGVDFQPWTILSPALPYIAVTGNIAKDSTWASGVFWIKNDIAVNTGFKLTIKPGVIVKLAMGSRLTVNGSINASGTQDSLVIFTSERDDSYGGDTNGDSTATLAARGNWDMVWLYYNQNNSSVLNNCIFKWGGSTGNGNVRVDGATPAINTIFSTQSSNYGLFLINGAGVSISNSTFGSNGSYGVYISSSNPNIYRSTIASNGSYGIYATGNSRFNVRKSKLTGNTYGIVADGGTSSATLISMDSSEVSFNTTAGLYLWYGTGPQTFSYNRIEGNGSGYGLWCFNVNSLVTIDSNIILNNGSEGIVTSKAFITNNLIKGNSYPITLIGRVNSTYSGNTIIGNQYNNALALRLNRSDESLQDTLNAVFPAGISSKTYVLIDDNSGIGVNSGTTLVIQPGVIIKMANDMYFRVDGTLIANGTLANPIVFTSYRDSSYGGKTNLLSDNIGPAPDDWRYVRLYTNSASASIINNCIFKYGGRNGNGNLYLSDNLVLANPITNTISRKSSSNGIYVYDCQVTFDNITLDSNSSYGMYVLGNRPSDVTVRNSVIQDNSGSGMQAVHNSAFREVSNCVIRRNNGWGIGTSNGTLDQVYQGNIVNNNSSGGIHTNSPPILSANLRFVGNTITDHPGVGILSSRATFIDNTIQRNLYPLAVWRRTGNIYTDPSGVDGNVISNNIYNAIAIWDAEISDTLKATFPTAITSKTYVAIYDFEVASGTTLIMEPGVIVKFQQTPVNNWQQFNVYGTLIANGTVANPIIFTSWRDSTAGGKTTSLTDFVPPAPGDWNYIAFRNGSGSSMIRNCQFKYGGRDGQKTVYFESNLGGLIFSNNIVRRSLSAGILVYSTPLNIDSTVVDSCGESGIHIGANSTNNVSIRYSTMIKNANYGVWVQNPAKMPVLSNCTISNNTLSGVYVENNTISLSVIGNTITNNGTYGLYILGRNDAIDTLLMIAGNKIRNNGQAGILSSRAYILDDSISGNKYAIGVSGQLSLAGTGNAAGNVYSGNFYSGNLYEGTLAAEGSLYGTLGQVFPNGYSSKVIAARGDLFVANGNVLSIYAGSIIKFSNETGIPYLYVDGVLNCSGVSNDKIVFTSWKDDTYGGDTNLDSAATIPLPGQWRQIYLNSDAIPSTFKQTIFKFGGLGNYDVIESNGNNFSMDSCVVSYSQYNGFYIQNADPVITGTDIHHNGQYGLYVAYASSPIINFNNIFQNIGGLYTYSISAGDTVNARNNFWGAQTGPLVNAVADPNIGGTGDKIQFTGSWYTKYRPFLFTRSGILYGDVSGNGQISAFDASMILQSVVSQITLNPIQRLAANVSGDTTVSALDASYVLRYVVGLISGFPGLGKQSLEAKIASAFTFSIEKAVNPDEFHLIIHLNKPTNVYGLNFSLSFDTALVKPLSIAKTMESDSMSMIHNFPSGLVNLAMAGIKPLNSEGNVAKFTFKLLDPAKVQKEVLFTVKKFILNETDVTSDVGKIILSVDKIVEIPTTFGLSQNYPNPFNPSTTIHYAIPVTSSVRMSVYNMLGQEVRMLVNTEQQAGFYSLVWNGRDNNDLPVASGIYIYRMDARAAGNKNFTQVKKMILVK